MGWQRRGNIIAGKAKWTFEVAELARIQLQEDERDALCVGSFSRQLTVDVIAQTHQVSAQIAEDLAATLSPALVVGDALGPGPHHHGDLQVVAAGVRTSQVQFDIDVCALFGQAEPRESLDRRLVGSALAAQTYADQ